MLSDQEIAQLKSEVGRGREIAQFVENELVKSTVQGMLNDIQKTWLGETRPAERELLWQRAMGLSEFWASFKTIVNTGKMAERQLADDAALRKHSL